VSARRAYIEPLEQRAMFAVYAGIDENFIGPLEAPQYTAYVQARIEAAINDGFETSSSTNPPPTSGTGGNSQPQPGPQTPALPPIDVRDFGATGDGVTNDTAAFTAAINALKAAGPGYTLLVPAGVYRISSTFAFTDMSDFTVRSEGATIKAMNSMTVGSYTGDVMRFTNCSRFTVEGFTLNGNRTARSNGMSVTLRVFGGSDFLVRNCTMLDGTLDHIYVSANITNGQLISRAHAGRFENCTLDNAYRNGVAVTNGYDLQFVGNTVRNVQNLAGIDLEANEEDGPNAVTDILVANNTISNCNRPGIYGTGHYPPARLTAYGNTVSNCAGGIVFYGDDHRILNNSVDGSAQRVTGIGITGKRGLIQGNNVFNGNHLAIYTCGTGNVVRDNSITDYGISDVGVCIYTISGSGGGFIDNNTIRKTIRNTNWEPIRAHELDEIGLNYRFGCEGTDGAF
jgi:hypothetical protein